MAKSSRTKKPAAAPARKSAPKAARGPAARAGASSSGGGRGKTAKAAPGRVNGTSAGGRSATPAKAAPKPPARPSSVSSAAGRGSVSRQAQARDQVGVGSRGEAIVARPQPRNAPSAAAAPGPIVAAVPTREPPRKNQAGFGIRDLENFRHLLLEKRREILGDMAAMEREALRSSGGSNLSNLPLHMADMGTDNYEQEFTLGLVEKERVLLREINAALAKIQDGTYGICEGTGKPITKVRLEVQPWARFSIEHARSLERRIR